MGSSSEHAHAFLIDLPARLAGRIQLASDGLPMCRDAVHDAFVNEIDNAFSKKMQNHVYSVSLHFMYYKFVKQHKSLGSITPAMAASVTDKLWSMEDIVRVVEEAEPAPKKRGPYKNKISNRDITA